MLKGVIAGADTDTDTKPLRAESRCQDVIFFLGVKHQPCHAVPCRAMPCHAVPCRAMPCHAMPTCSFYPCSFQEGQPKRLGDIDVALIPNKRRASKDKNSGQHDASGRGSVMPRELSTVSVGLVCDAQIQECISVLVFLLSPQLYHLETSSGVSTASRPTPPRLPAFLICRCRANLPDS